MDFKDQTIGEMLESEKEMVATGAQRYGEYYINAADFNVLLGEFLESVNLDRFVFTAFLSQVKKHATLAMFSVVRLHHTQAMMNMRQVLEAGASAAYAIVNPNVDDFAKLDENGILQLPDSLTKKRYKWLEQNFLKGSDSIKNMKKAINSSTAHSNIVYAQKIFKFNPSSGKFETPFFDIEDDYSVKADLWLIGNVLMGLMDLFYGVNIGVNAIKFKEDFIPRLKALEAQNHKLRQLMMADQRYQDAMKIISQSNNI